MVSNGELLIISLFFITSFNCALTYFCCSKSLKILEIDKSISKAVNKLRILDQYLLSKINVLVALGYFGLSYLFVESKIPESEYVFFLSCLLSFPLTLISTFASRVCYCYTCNVLLETKLNEWECLVVNIKRLGIIYLPFLIISFVIPTVYLFGLKEFVSNFIIVTMLLFLMILWIILIPHITALSYKAKAIEKNSLLGYRLERLMEKHGIKRYKLYYWDSSRTKESNAMVSGIGKCNLFISSCLIEEVTLPELETVVTHEIGHVKNKHLLKMMIGKLFVVVTLVLMSIAPHVFEFGYWENIVFYFIAFVFVVGCIIAGIGIERRYEEKADMYAAGYNDPDLFASALKKITKYEDDSKNKIDELFQSHPDIKERIEKVKKGEL